MKEWRRSYGKFQLPLALNLEKKLDNLDEIRQLMCYLNNFTTDKIARENYSIEDN